MPISKARLQKSLAAREVKVQRLRKFHVFCLSLILQVETHEQFHHELLLPKDMDVNLTAREVTERFGHQCCDIFEHIFIRWQTKWADRPAAWKINPIVARDYGRWLRDNQDATPSEALKALKDMGAEKLRRARVYTLGGPGEAVIMSAKQHKKLLDEAQRAIRKAWATSTFREDKAKEEGLR